MKRDFCYRCAAVTDHYEGPELRCAECKREYSNRYFLRNRAKRLKQIRAYNARAR